MHKKVCSKCKIEKILIDFTRQKRGKYGYSSVCRECRKKIENTKKENIKIILRLV
jgi:superfamily II helicase